MDSPAARYAVPDFLNVGVGFTGIPGIGGGTSLELQWVLRGPEASVRPLLTVSQSVGAGFPIDATLNVGWVNYLGSVNDITRNMGPTSIVDGFDLSG